MKTKEQLNKELDAFLADSEKALKAAKKLISSTETVLQTIREMKEAEKASQTKEDVPSPEQAKAEAQEPAKEESASKDKTYSFEEVRGIMAGIAGQGKRTEAKALLQKFGVAKLSEIKPEDYTALVQEAQVIANG